MNWYCKKFDDLSVKELFLIYKERVSVFVVEQKCPYQEVDDKDLLSYHLFKTNGKEIVAYCRIIPEEDGIHIGRVLVKENERKYGIGKEVVGKALEFIKKEWGSISVYAQAQAHLEKFYNSFGFEGISDIYLEDNIPHLDMILQI